jgi:hypothetical protein
LTDRFPGWIHNIQVSSSDLAPVRSALCSAAPQSYQETQERRALKDLAEEELRCARLHAKQQISDDVWATLWHEWQDQRHMIKANLEAMDRHCETHITTLDDALNLIAKAGIIFDKLPQLDQQELLRHLVKWVVINPEGQILRLDLQTPFSYLYELMNTVKELPNPEELRHGSRTRKRTSRRLSTCSVHVPPGSPKGTLDEPVEPFLLVLAFIVIEPFCGSRICQSFHHN